MCGRGCVCGGRVCMVGGVHGKKGVRMAGGMCGGGMHGRGHAWWGVCVTGGGYTWSGGHAWQGGPLQRAVRILLECILV